MKIDESDIKKITGATTGAAMPARTGKGEKAGASSVGGSAPTENNVHLSSQAQALAAQVSNAEVYNAERVRKIKDAIERGEFVVDPNKVADGLLDTVNSLIRTRKA